jgi:hypothetical protein
MEEVTTTLPPPAPSPSAGLSMAGLSNALEDHAHDFADRSQSGQAAVPRLNSDFNCTAESGVGGRAESEGGAVPVWSPSVPSQSQLQASVECLVPEVAKTRQGSLSRRLTQPTPRLNQDATAPNKVWHLMSNSIISIVLKVWSWSNKNCVISVGDMGVLSNKRVYNSFTWLEFIILLVL